MKRKYYPVLMKHAMEVAELSRCKSLHVGAVVANDEGHCIISGYNGTPSGMQNCCDVHHEEGQHHAWSLRHEVHAEANALLHAAKHGLSVNGCTVFVTTAPCHMCAIMLRTAGIVRVVFKDFYHRDVNGRSCDQLREMGIEVEQFSPE